MDWATVTTVAITAASTLTAGFGGVVLQGRIQERVERRNRVQRDAEVLGPIESLLTEMNPYPLGILAGRETFPEVFRELEDRRRAAGDALATMSIGHPSATVRSLARQLEMAMTSIYVRSWLLVHQVGGSPDFEEKREAANRDYAEACRLADELAEAIRSEDKAEARPPQLT
jgi:hypothetical protein